LTLGHRVSRQPLARAFGAGGGLGAGRRRETTNRRSVRLANRPLYA